jgi:hypothetical protein
MMGERRSGQEVLFYEFSLERHVPVEHLLRSVDRFCRSRRGAVRARAVFQRGGTAFGRSGADDPDADRRLLLWYPLGAPPGAARPSVRRFKLCNRC